MSDDIIKQIIDKPCLYATQRHGLKPVAIVIHITDGYGMPDSWFERNPRHVSAHFCVGRQGELHQYVHTSQAAAHAGIIDRPSAEIVREHGKINPNYYTIGIEHEGNGGDALTPEQWATSLAIVRFVAKKWGIPLDRKHIIGHREIRASKTCPGTGVDLEEYVRRLCAQDS